MRFWCGTLLFLSVLVPMLVIEGSPSQMHTRGHQVPDGQQENKERITDAFESHLHSMADDDDADDDEVDDHDLDHEAILGSRTKAQEFDGLSAQESKRRLKILVEKGGMDANQDGYVDRDELRRWVLKAFESLAREEGQERMKEEDNNDDQMVTWQEHVKQAFDLDEDELKVSGSDSAHRNELLEEDRALWKAADRNGDGRLDATEFPAFNSPEEFEHMHQILVEQMLERRDRNRDGFIDFEEFISDENGNAPDPNTEHYLTEKDKFQNEYDANHDMRLDFQECMAWIIPNNTDIADQEAMHLISSADTDHDGKLSVNEIVDNHDIFVGSEATDFGQQLHTHVRDEL